MSLKPGTTLETLLARVKKEVAEKAKQSEKKKAEARAERMRRGPEPSMYEREELWVPLAVHREYEIQICDCCQGKQYYFNGDKIELRHKYDRSARKWRRDRGELMCVVEQTKEGPRINQLPVRVTILERVIPECYDCFTLGKTLNHLFRKGNQDEKETQGAEANAQARSQAAPQPQGVPQAAQVGASASGAQQEPRVASA